MRRLPDPVLVVLVGPSSSGKSTWAARHFRAGQVVSSDALRGVVGDGEHDLAASVDAFALLDEIVRRRLARRLTTVVDTLGFDAARRDRWRRLAEEHGVPAIAVAFATPAGVCRERNRARPDRVPADVLTAQLRSFRAVRPALDGEGWSEVVEPEPLRVVPPAFAAPVPLVAPDANAPPARQGLRIALHLSTWPSGRELRDRLPRLAAEAEAAGVSSIYVMDHLRQIPQVGRAWDDLPESLTVLAGLAAATDRVRLGCLVHGISLRPVAVLGKALATLDVLAGGRVVCGLGVGWFAAELDAAGVPFPPLRERYELLEDALQALPLLWGKGSPAFEGRRLRLPEALCYPRPLQARLPIVVGGSGERRTLPLAARLADGVNLFGDALAVERRVALVRREAAAAGRDPSLIETSHLATALVGRDDEELAALVGRHRSRRASSAAWAARTNPGTVDDHVHRLAALASAGVDEAVLAMPDAWEPGAMERLASLVAAVGTRLGPPA